MEHPLPFTPTGHGNSEFNIGKKWSPIWSMKNFLCQKRYGSLVDFKREFCKLVFKLDFTARSIMESLSEFGLWIHLVTAHTHCKDTILKVRNKYSQKRNCAATVLILTFTFLWAIYIFPWSVCLFCCRKIGGPNVGLYRSLTDTNECGNWDWGCAISFLRIHKSKFLCSAQTCFHESRILVVCRGGGAPTRGKRWGWRGGQFMEVVEVVQGREVAPLTRPQHVHLPPGPSSYSTITWTRMDVSWG